MIQALIGPIASLAGSWMEKKVSEQKGKSAVAIAKAEAEAEVMKVAATHEAGWEKIMAQGSQESWKDEAWTICFIVLIICAFVPDLQPYVKQGIEFLSTFHEWLQWSILASIGASFGLKSIGKFKR